MNALSSAFAAASTGAATETAAGAIDEVRSVPAILDAADRAAGRVPPLWPLHSFVAVNPFLGLADRPFEAAAEHLARVGDARLTMPRHHYAEALADGRIEDADLARAFRMVRGRPASVTELEALKDAADGGSVPAARVPTVAEVASTVSGTDWSEVVTARISAWAAAHYDEGQALWRSPWRSLSPFAAWRSQALLDRTPELLGVRVFRRTVAGLPTGARTLVVEAARRLGVPEGGLDAYFHRLLLSVAGWAGYARYRGWGNELARRPDGGVIELLAVRLAWEVALLEAFGRESQVGEAWADACLALPVEPAPDPATRAGCVLQTARELAWQRSLLAGLAAPAPALSSERKAVQAVFCIDVRSEAIRRALEAQDDGIATSGFAGFFGFPLDHRAAGHEHGTARCPVLIKPSVTVPEQEGTEHPGKVDAGRRLASAIRLFRTGSTAAFGFVEAVGLSYLARLLADGLGTIRRPPSPRTVPALALDPGIRSGGVVGIPLARRIELAEGALRGMSLTEGFARLVLFVGHGSTSTNNPHASGLDCGACGGHSGDVNARVAAAVLNDPAVRGGLAGRGIEIPGDTVFLAALHDTTTDRVTLFDEDGVPETHGAEIGRLRAWLAMAGTLARRSRPGSAEVDHASLERLAVERSQDWSQVRPEWGLAGCAAFIAAPRSRTGHRDLDGRAFLHCYDWRRDDGFAVLETILTAPMVVASWINLQYYASTVDNRRFGAGNKVLHNVAGGIGVFEGGGGDLRSTRCWIGTTTSATWSTTAGST
jgi:uncharacterized protein YbcC (UPF0753/DUF2309 family)